MRLQTTRRTGRRLTGGLVAAAVATSLLVLAPPSQADPSERKRHVDAGIHAVQESLAGTSQELQAAYAALAASQERLPVAQAELEAAEAARAEAQRKDAELAARLAAAEQSEANQAESIDEGRQEIADTESSIGRIAAQAYRRGGLDTGLSLAFGSQDPDEFADRYLLVDTALRSQSGAMARLTQQQAVLANQQARLEAVRAEVADLREQAAANLEVARQAEADAAARKAEVEQLIAQQTQATAVIQARKAEEEAHLAALQREQDALEAELRRIAEEERRRAAERAARERNRGGGGGGGSAPAPAPPSGGVLSRPVTTRITSSYGWRVHPIYGTRRMHTGTDFGGPCGVPVRAAADGSVVRAGRAGGYGNQIVVNHGLIGGSAFATSYNHLSSYAVRSGSVSRGQVIGYIGTTGASTGCHLHFEVFVNGSRTNPMQYL
ncbi:peptidoglycan DD-metalloendopeptidase family protein [Thalassiella azotivora]